MEIIPGRDKWSNNNSLKAIFHLDLTRFFLRPFGFKFQYDQTTIDSLFLSSREFRKGGLMDEKVIGILCSAAG
jgi:hypothetical protein